MPFFADETEVNKYIGGAFEAARDSEVGPKMATADIDMVVYYSEPEATLLVKMHGENIEVLPGQDNEDADVKLFMPADIADKYWRGEYNLAVGLAKRQVRSKGPVNKILKLVPLTKPLFARYRELTADKPQPVAG